MNKTKDEVHAATRAVDGTPELASANRRHALKLAAAAGLSTLGLCCGSRSAFADDGAADERPQPGDLLVLDVDGEPKPLKPGDVPLEAKPIQVFPYDPAAKVVRKGSRLNKVLLVRLPDAKMDASTKDRSADGVIAYSAICTHQGCDVTEWQKEDNTLLCFCHFSKYNPYAAAEVMAGPAPRNLPYLSLKTDNGVLVVAAKFSSAPGPRNS